MTIPPKAEEAMPSDLDALLGKQVWFDRKDVIAILAKHNEAHSHSAPSEHLRWIAEAKETLERLSRFLQHIGAPHAVDWREWIDNAERHLALRAAITEWVASPATPLPRPPEPVWITSDPALVDCIKDT